MHQRMPGGSIRPRIGSSRPLANLGRALNLDRDSDFDLHRHERHARHADALAAGDVVLVGNRAGLVEWTTEAWTRLTGFPLEQTLGKPITHFLERAGLEVDLAELVDIVAQDFLDGRPINLELPFTTLDGREIEIHLAVEPIREPILPAPLGDRSAREITRFIAVVREAATSTPRPHSAPTPRIHPQEITQSSTAPPADAPSLDRPDDTRLEATPNANQDEAFDARRANADFDFDFDIGFEVDIDIARALSAAVERTVAHHRDDRVFEMLCENDLPEIPGDSHRLAECLDRALDSTTEANAFGTTFVTTDCGWLEPRRSHRSLVHPIAARAIAPSSERRLFLEIHDTLPHLDREAVARIRDGQPGRTSRERSIAKAARLATTLGFSFHLDSTAGCGTQLLFVVPGRWPGECPSPNRNR